MTIGIYRLVFQGTSLCYIGQSINIEARFKQHLLSLRNETASKKMLKAYTLYGDPTLEIISECLPSELDDLEREAIEVFDSINNGLNMAEVGLVPKHYGEDHPSSRYSNAKIIEIAELLVGDTLSILDIAKLVNVDKSLVYNISNLRGHTWLKEEYPNLFNKLILLLERKNQKLSIQKRNYRYPSVVSPYGEIVHDISNLEGFCRQHALKPFNFKQMLKGIHKSCQGWTLYGQEYK